MLFGKCQVVQRGTVIQLVENYHLQALGVNSALCHQHCASMKWAGLVTAGQIRTGE